ncbi:MAG: choice-of-anchor E domain-containing protein [Planctomycetes bacterium]|nr:choice-of-anchor E domain-containing protein [Planctomycetota bacterium]
MSPRMMACIVLGISLLLATSVTANTITVNSLPFTVQWPTPNPAPPPANGTTISTGPWQIGIPMFNPTLGYLTKSDVTFEFSTLYGGSIRNFSTSAYEGSIVSNSGTTAKFSMAPFGTLWNFAAPTEGGTPTVAVNSFGTSFFVSSPTRGHGSPTFTFTNQEHLNHFIGLGNVIAEASQTYAVNLAVSPARAGVSVASFQRAFAPRARAVYTFNPFSTPVHADGGLTFSLAEGPTSGQGQIEPTPLGIQHGHMVEAGPSQGPVLESTNARQTFRFAREDGRMDETLVFINGVLDGLLRADGGGRAEAVGVIELYTGSGSPIDRIERFVYADSRDMNNSLNQLRARERFGLLINLIPGNVYELRTQMRLLADPRGAGSALADFSNTFDVELSGEPIPEPGTASGLISAVAASLAFRCRTRRRTS